MNEIQTKLVAVLRKWAAYARNADKLTFSRVMTEEGNSEALDFCMGDFASPDLKEYQLFRDCLLPEGMREAREAFDERRRKTQEAYRLVMQEGANPPVLARLADALDFEAESIGNFDLSRHADTSEKAGDAERVERIESKLDEQGGLLLSIATTVDETNRNTRPQETRRGRYEVSQEKAAKLLGRTKRTIINWEHGKNTPEGYSRETRLTWKLFNAWADGWTATQRNKINVKKAVAYADGHGYTYAARRR